MSLVVPDTGVLIELFRRADAAREKERNRWRFCISAVVHSELTRGVRTHTEQRFVANLARAFPPIAPTAVQWTRCGGVLSKLCRDHDFDGRGMQLVQNDVLIALTARGLGLPLVTTNALDFELISGYVGGLKVMVYAASS